MVTKFGTLLARPILRMRININRISGQKMTARSFISLRERPLFKARAWPFLEHATRGHFDTLKTQELECGVGWIMLNDGVTILICEDCKVILRAQVRLILCTLLVTCECVVSHTQGHEPLVLEVAHWESHIHLYEVRIGDNELWRAETGLAFL